MKCRISSPVAQWIFTTALTNDRNGPLSGWPSCSLVVPSGREAEHSETRGCRAIWQCRLMCLTPIWVRQAWEELRRDASQEGDDLCRRWG
jgi:hypothetical protein